MQELRQQYPLAGLLKQAGLARSTFYYQQKVVMVGDKHIELKERIRIIYADHQGRYGDRRITAAIGRLGEQINHKKVLRLMGGSASNRWCGQSQNSSI